MRHFDWRPAFAALLVGVAYYAGAKVGLALTFQPLPISVLWPPNAVLLAALLLAPVRWWWVILVGALPAHFIAEWQGGVPIAMVSCWFVSNVSEALIGACCVRRFMAQPPSLDSMRNAVAFICGAVVLAPFLSSFLDAAFVTLIGWGESSYRDLWATRFVSNMLATLTFVPVVITWAARTHGWPRPLSGTRWLEGAFILAGLLTVGVLVFDWNFAASGIPPTFLYLPLPFMLWAAMRFGPRGASLSFTIVALLVIWGAVHERGPFAVGAAAENALSVQLFLISVAIPLLVLAAVLEERKATYRRLRSSEERFATAFRSSPDAIVISRAMDGKIIEVNDRWRAMFGYSRDEALGHTMAELGICLSEKGRIGPVCASGAGEARAFERDFKAKGGDVLQALVSSETVEIDGESCLITTIRDITLQRRAELEAREHRQQLTHLSRLAMLSDFSGALAHELNQPLAAILSNAQAAQRFLAMEEVDLAEIRGILRDIVEADKRAGNVIRRLRVLMRKGETPFAPVDLNQVVHEVLEFTHSDLVRRSVEVTATFGASLPPVNGDRVQLQQLMLNLISNACEALEGAGRGGRRLELTTASGPSGSVQLIVSDSGPGIVPAAFERLFEPFFTTKEHGLGLGLSICRTIATAHGGKLHAENNPGRGASFRAVFPGVAKRPEP